MREIQFRGKHQETGKWVYGSFIPDLMEVYQNGPYGWLGDWGFIKPFEKDKNGLRNMTYVQRNTVGQYTGLTDKNGVKIFEGDIVEFFGMRGEIISECGAFGIGCQKQIDYDLMESNIPCNNTALFCYNDNYISLWELWWNYEQDDNPLYEVEVIGNIYDNPELMEDKQC